MSILFILINMFSFQREQGIVLYVAPLTGSFSLKLMEECQQMLVQAPNHTSNNKVTARKTNPVTSSRTDDHIVMQLRKAQDLEGEMDIRVAFNKTVRLPLARIDRLLAVHDVLKPVDKRAFRVLLLRKLRMAT